MKTIQAEPKGSEASKTIETMFRITSSNSQRLSDQADTKSHIMITVNAIIVSVLLTYTARYFEMQSPMVVPLMTLLLVNVCTIIFATLATRPTVPKGTFTTAEFNQKKTNLLFFGNFYRMKFEDYSSSMLQVMHDRPFLYNSLLRDLFCQGVVLGRKYRMLTIAYNVFLFGLIVSVIAFVIVSGFTSLK